MKEQYLAKILKRIQLENWTSSCILVLLTIWMFLPSDSFVCMCNVYIHVQICISIYTWWVRPDKGHPPRERVLFPLLAGAEALWPTLSVKWTGAASRQNFLVVSGPVLGISECAYNILLPVFTRTVEFSLRGKFLEHSWNPTIYNRVSFRIFNLACCIVFLAII